MKRPQLIFLTPSALEILERHRERHPEHVFISSVTGDVLERQSVGKAITRNV